MSAELIMERVERLLLNGLDSIITRLEAIQNQPVTPPAVWEAISVAKATRGVGRETLLAAVKDGRVASRRAPTHGGHLSWDLSVYDLDRHFPRRTTKKATT